MDRDNIRANLIGSRKLIESGWVKGSLESYDESGNHCYCAYGAICYSSFGGRYFDAYQYMNDFVKKEGLDAGIIAYNDAPETTKEDILAVFDRAIKELEESE